MHGAQGTAEAARRGTGAARCMTTGHCHSATEGLCYCHRWPMPTSGHAGHVALAEECACTTGPPCKILPAEMYVTGMPPDEVGYVWGYTLELLKQLAHWCCQAVPRLVWFRVPGAPPPGLHRALVCPAAATRLPHGCTDAVQPHGACQQRSRAATGFHWGCSTGWPVRSTAGPRDRDEQLASRARDAWGRPQNRHGLRCPPDRTLRKPPCWPKLRPWWQARALRPPLGFRCKRVPHQPRPPLCTEGSLEHRGPAGVVANPMATGCRSLWDSQGWLGHPLPERPWPGLGGQEHGWRQRDGGMASRSA